MLGISRTRVRQLEGESLHPKKNNSGINQFDSAEVQRLAARRATPKPTIPGSVVAHVFRLFRDGVSIADVVIETELDLDTVEALYERYKTPLGAPPRAVTEARQRREEEELEAMQREWETQRRMRRSR